MPRKRNNFQRCGLAENLSRESGSQPSIPQQVRCADELIQRNRPLNPTVLASHGRGLGRLRPARSRRVFLRLDTSSLHPPLRSHALLAFRSSHSFYITVLLSQPQGRQRSSMSALERKVMSREGMLAEALHISRASSVCLSGVKLFFSFVDEEVEQSWLRLAPALAGDQTRPRRVRAAEHEQRSRAGLEAEIGSHGTSSNNGAPAVSQVCHGLQDSLLPKQASPLVVDPPAMVFFG